MLTVYRRGHLQCEIGKASCQQVKGDTLLVPKRSICRNYLDYMMDRKTSEARKKTDGLG